MAEKASVPRVERRRRPLRFKRALKAEFVHDRYQGSWGCWIKNDGVIFDRWRFSLFPWPGRGLVVSWGDLSRNNF